MYERLGEDEMYQDEQALHLTYDAYVTQGMEDHERGALHPDDFIFRLLNAGVVVRMATALIAAADASGEGEPYVPKETYKYDAASNRIRRLLGGIPQDDDD